MLEDKGFDTGNAGKNGPYKELSTEITDSEPTEAERLQMKAERNGISLLTHDEILKVANRLPRIGSKDETKEWFQKQLDSEYDDLATEKQLDSILDRYDDL